MRSATCWECGAAGVVHHHHVVPRSRGGTRTLPLCEGCHAAAHHRDRNMTTSATTREAMQRKKSKGEFIGGGVPYGFRVAADGVHLVEDEFEQATIATARAVRAHGLSLRKIGEELSRLGFTTRKGGKWYPTQIRRLLIAPSQIAEVARGEVVAEQSTITIQPTLFGEVRS